jgi:hypothetical protein
MAVEKVNLLEVVIPGLLGVCPPRDIRLVITRGLMLSS